MLFLLDTYYLSHEFKKYTQKRENIFCLPVSLSSLRKEVNANTRDLQAKCRLWLARLALLAHHSLFLSPDQSLQPLQL